jgi:hypothetical protein
VVEPFWQKLIIAATGPLTAAIIGTLLIGLFAARITRRTQERRENHQLRGDLIEKMTEVASALNIRCQEYSRTKHQKEVDTVRLERVRAELDEQYIKTRLAGVILESRLQVFFRSDKPKLLWHSTTDLLTVRYLQLTDQATDERLSINAGPEHSGLTVEELRDPEKIIKAYRSRLRDATQAILREDLVRPS